MKITIIIYAITLVFALIALIRNDLVSKERGRLITWIFKQEDWKEKKKLLENPSYDKMLIQFWKPVKSYYKKYLKE